jgi:hypothetical protein
VGAGGLFTSDETLITLPIGINYLVGKNTKSYLELGGGFTLVSSKTPNPHDDFRGSFAFLNINYRYQPKNNGISFRAGFMPSWGKHFTVPYMPVTKYRLQILIISK